VNTKQEEMWRGHFGDEYALRSPGNELSNRGFFTSVLRQNENKRLELGSIVELGAGVGSNLRALHWMYPGAELAAVELNDSAAGKLPAYVDLHLGSILDWEPTKKYELAFTKGVLIHINPDHLGMAYETLHRASSRWILIAEYYNPTPVEVQYRGHEGLLFKRDFAGEMLDRHKDLKMKGYGFVWKRDPDFPQDDITWFLLEKQA
jgi:spore coat polysaccharide biosynthesis protein SpsF